MIALKIQEDDIKDFMGKLFKEELLDSFEVRGVEIVTITSFEISGVYDKSSLTEDEARESAYYLNWGQLKPYVYNIIKGSRRPRTLKIIFSMSSERTAAFNANASALFLNMNFDSGDLIFTTGMSQKNFTMDKTLEVMWDDYARSFFTENGLKYAEVE